MFSAQVRSVGEISKYDVIVCVILKYFKAATFCIGPRGDY